jgi:putative endonuclease
MEKQYCIYILRSFTGKLYIGVTSNLVKRLWEHKNKVVDGFTKKYNVDKLVYYEVYESIESAILREKQLKKWSRRKKIELIVRVNPIFKEIPMEDIV